MEFKNLLLSELSEAGINLTFYEQEETSKGVLCYVEFNDGYAMDFFLNYEQTLDELAKDIKRIVNEAMEDMKNV